MSNKKISILNMEKSNIEFKKSHYVSVSGFDTQTEKVPSWFKKFHEEEFKPLQQAVIDLYTKPPEWFTKFANEQRQFNLMVIEFIKEQKQFNQFVMDQFKKHGWVK